MTPREPRPGQSRAYFESEAQQYQERMMRGVIGTVRALEHRAICRALEPRPGDRVLDAGCGSGYHLRRLADRGCHVRGIDFSPAMVEICRGQGLCAEVADLIDFDLGESFDKILCAGALEFCHPIAAVYANLAKHLQPGGTAVLCYPTPGLVGTAYRLFHSRHGLAVALRSDSVVASGLREHGFSIEARWLATPLSHVVRARYRS